MHIKQITINNFRSFRQQTEIEPFSPAMNAIVGRNGSGKSNLFDAVQFVLLAPRFANLRQEERQALLHEGSGSAAVNAFVEIVFDNSDNRFSMEHSDEVVLRRIIGLKKDEFFLQHKRATKQEVQSLLEGAGFSKSNPYFIVQQGKVQDLCTMSDTERLNLLKEVAGTTVYDEKKAESLAKMEENASSIDKITEILEGIEERLGELESEKEELTQYQIIDRQRRVISYTLFEKELQKARNILTAIEEERNDDSEAVAALHDTAKQSHEEIGNLQASIKAKQNTLRRNLMTLQSLEQDGKNAVTKCAKLQLECQELADSVQTEAEQLVSNQKELKLLEKEIAVAEKELNDKVRPDYDRACEELQAMTDRRDAAKKQMDAIYAKQGRGRQFSSVAERDAFLQESIQELEAARSEKQAALEKEQDSLSNLRRTIDKEVKDIAVSTKQLEQQTNGLQTISKTIDEKKRQRLALHDERKEDWRKTEELREQVREARENFHRAASDMRKVMPRATAMGLEALKTIVEAENLVLGKHYFGMLMDNMTLRAPRFQTAVEVAAQNALFHVIVDTDETAAKLMKRLEEEQLGRVTFLPLNRLVIEKVNYPESNDVRPMLDMCINYDKKVERAMQHVFGKKLLAGNTEVATAWSTKVSMDVITMDGDLCSRKGALTGGYVDLNKSRLRAHVKQKDTRQILQTVEREYREMSQKAQQVDVAVTSLMQEIQRLESKHAELSHKVSESETELEKVQSRRGTHATLAEKVEKETIPDLERGIASLDTDITRLKDEMGTELREDLSAADRELIQKLKKEQSDLAPEIDSQSDVVAEMGVSRQTLLSLLNDNLLKRRQELTEGISLRDEDKSSRRSSFGRVSSIALQAQRKEELEDRQRQLDEANSVKADLEVRVEQARQGEAQLRSDLIAAKNELENLRSQDTKNTSALAEAEDKANRLLTKRSRYISQRDDSMQKIQALGSLPPPAEQDKFKGKSITDLNKALEAANQKLKKYTHLNKKAYDQFVNFSEQRESLIKRKEELDQGAEKVNELVESLDRQKDEAINRTFRGVSAHFKDVFQELVPAGAGELLMRTAIDDSGETDQEAESDEEPSPKKTLDPNNPDVSLYRGVGIKVRFSEVGENFMMSQLSGGQKALVAMALIFAIQRCDPAPFYLFDELDQALDSSYRSTVADLIFRQANSKDNPTQFIVSTFRPELVTVANQTYGIAHQNKVSNLHQMGKKDALSFVSSLMNDEEAVGEVTTVATSRGSLLTRGSRKRKSSEAEASEKEKDGDASHSGAEMSP